MFNMSSGYGNIAGNIFNRRIGEYTNTSDLEQQLASRALNKNVTKRAFDLVLATFALVLLSPVLVIVAAAIIDRLKQARGE